MTVLNKVQRTQAAPTSADTTLPPTTDHGCASGLAGRQNSRTEEAPIGVGAGLDLDLRAVPDIEGQTLPLKALHARDGVSAAPSGGPKGPPRSGTKPPLRGGATSGARRVPEKRRKRLNEAGGR